MYTNMHLSYHKVEQVYTHSTWQIVRDAYALYVKSRDICHIGCMLLVQLYNSLKISQCHPKLPSIMPLTFSSMRLNRWTSILPFLAGVLVHSNKYWVNPWVNLSSTFNIGHFIYIYCSPHFSNYYFHVRKIRISSTTRQEYQNSHQTR